MMKKTWFTLFFAILITHGIFAQEIRLSAIPYPLQLENVAKDLKVLDANHFRLVSPAHTDLFVSPDGKNSTHNAPRILFKPDSDFILTAGIKLRFQSNWDAGCLLIYSDSSHFAKFCFEKDYTGQPRVVAVVCNEVADDCNSIAIDKGEVYYRITGSAQSNTFNFYYSPDGKSWFLIRSFRLNRTRNLRIGFGAQSPIGKECTVDFSDISLQQRKLNDFWGGN